MTLMDLDGSGGDTIIWLFVKSEACELNYVHCDNQHVSVLALITAMANHGYGWRLKVWLLKGISLKKPLTDGFR